MKSGLALHPRTPVIIGVGDVINRDGPLLDPIDLAATAARRAFHDTGTDVTALIDTVAVPGIILMHRDHPAHRIADSLGLASGRRVSCPVGGNTPQYLVGELGARIFSGDCDMALVVGAEAGHTAIRARKDGTRLSVGSASGADTTMGDDRPGLSDVERAAGLFLPADVYPMFDAAFASRAGRTLDEQRRWLGTLMAPFTAEAARQPDRSWFPTERTAAELSTPTDGNRLISEPYTKLLNSFLFVDMGAAFVLTAAEVAERAGVPRDRWVFSWGSATCNDVYFPVERPDLGASAGIREAGDAVLATARVSVDEIAWFDLYSCFPAAVSAAVDALGLEFDDPRGFTVTGGLPYHGGPGNNYVTHALAAMVRRCREDDRGIGLVSGLGWYLTKHSLGLWSAAPPRSPWQRPDMSRAQAAIDATALRVAPLDEAVGPAIVDAYSVVHDRDTGPCSVPVIATLADGRRTIARSDDAELARHLSGGMFIGDTIEMTIGADGPTFHLV